MGLSDMHYSVAGHIILNGMSETNSVPITNGCDVYMATPKLIYERQVMIGSHTCPATTANLTIEDVY